LTCLKRGAERVCVEVDEDKSLTWNCGVSAARGKDERSDKGVRGENIVGSCNVLKMVKKIISQWRGTLPGLGVYPTKVIVDIMIFKVY